MTATLAQTETALSVSWSVVNNAAESIYVCVRGNLDNELVTAPYTYLSEQDAVLVMTFRKIPIPPNMEVFAPDIPFYRLLEAGQSTEETCEVKIPVREIHPYGERTYPEQTIAVRVSKVVFSVEYFWLRDKHFARQTDHDPALVKAGGGQHFLLEKAFQLTRPVTVLKRTDAFFRY
jgi:hypothetical protein